MNKFDEKVLEYLGKEKKRADKACEGHNCSENAARAHEVDTIDLVIRSILSQKPEFIFEKMDPAAKMPVKAHPTDAGWDIFANEYTKLHPFTTIPVRTGLKCKIPEGWEIQVRCRGSIALKDIIISNSPGTVDSGYRGEIMVLMMNMNPNYGPYEIDKGQKIAQLIFAPTYDISVKEGVVEQDSDRNSNWNGSTGTK